MHGAAFFLHLHLVGQLGGQLQPHTVRVKKVNAFENMVVGHAQHGNALGLKPGFHGLQLGHGVDAKRNVIHPQRRIGRWQRGLVVTQVKKRNERTVLQPEEKVGVGAVFTGTRHDVALDDVKQRQAQDVLIKMPCFLGIFGTVGVMVQLLDGGRRGQLVKGCHFLSFFTVYLFVTSSL